MTKKKLVEAAKDINKVCDLDPPIDIKADDEKLKDDVKDAGQDVRESDDLNEDTWDVLQGMEVGPRYKPATRRRGKKDDEKDKDEPEPEEKEEEEEDDKDTPPDVNKMTRKELKALIKEQKLEVIVLKKDSDKDLREKVADALGIPEPEEEEEEEEDDDKDDAAEKKAAAKKKKDDAAKKKKDKENEGPRYRREYAFIDALTKSNQTIEEIATKTNEIAIKNDLKDNKKQSEHITKALLGVLVYAEVVKESDGKFKRV